MNEISTTVSGTIPTAHEEAIRLDYEIKSEAQNIVNGICRIGRCLKQMKEQKLYGELGFNSLEAYAEAAVGLKGRAAYNYISAYETYGEQGLERYGSLGITKLAALAQLTAPEREELLESGKAEELSTRELNEEIKKLKHQCEQLSLFAEEKKKAELSLDEAKKEIEQLRTELEKERQEMVLPAPQMSEEEKEEIRAAIEAEQKRQHEQELEEAVEAARREEAELSEKVQADYAQKLKKEQKKAAEHELEVKKQSEQIAALSQQLKASQAENQKLQANAQKLPPSGNKELLKFLMQDIITKFNQAAELINRFPCEEQEACRQGLKKVAEKIKEVGEIL